MARNNLGRPERAGNNQRGPGRAKDDRRWWEMARGGLKWLGMAGDGLWCPGVPVGLDARVLKRGALALRDFSSKSLTNEPPYLRSVDWIPDEKNIKTTRHKGQVVTI